MEETNLIATTALIVTLFVIMLGPLKVIGPFYINTIHADKKLRFKIATRAVLIATLVSLVIFATGNYFMSRLSLSPGILTITMGLFMLHWAVQNALPQNPEQPVQSPENPSLKLAIFPVALPEIIPPQAVALLLLSSNVYLSSSSSGGLLFIVSLIVGVMALNWIFMLITPSLMKFPIFWKVIGRIVAVILSAVSLQIIYFGVVKMIS